MKIKTYDIKIPYEKIGIASLQSIKLTAYTIEPFWEIGRKKRPAVIICPGGGYEKVAVREAEPVALRFVSMGIHAFVLQYSVVRVPFPTALLELAQSTAFVRANAENWDIDPNRIAICGFSAGGHLAASLGVHWNKKFVKDTLDFTDEHRPNALILSYPVITSGKYTHSGSIANIAGLHPDQSVLDLISLEKHVNKNTPRTFIWHCADDEVVPVENTLLFMQALSRNKISFQSSIYPHGGHGISLCDDTTSSEERHYNKKCSQWIADAIDWLKNPDI